MCREFMRGACKRAESECRFAHPQESVSSHEDGSVTVCMDAVKGRCAREPCRYFHPPLHLQAQIKAVQTRATAVWLNYFNPPPLANKQTITKKQNFAKPITKRIRHQKKKQIYQTKNKQNFHFLLMCFNSIKYSLFFFCCFAEHPQQTLLVLFDWYFSFCCVLLRFVFLICCRP